MNKKKPATMKKPKQPVAPACDLPCLLCGAKGPSNRRVTIKTFIVQMGFDGHALDWASEEISRTCDLCPDHAVAARTCVAAALEKLGIPTFLTKYGLASVPSVPSTEKPT